MYPTLFLNYHSLHDTNNPSAHFDPVYTVHKSDFSAQLEILKRHKIKVLQLEEWLNMFPKNLNFSEPSVVITFDDWHESDYYTAAPELENHQFSATFFVPSSKLCPKEEKKIRCLLNRGFSIGSHTVNHKLLNLLEKEELTFELSVSKKQLEQISGKNIEVLALPGGRSNDQVIKQARSVGYSCVLTTKTGYNNSSSDLYNLKRWTIKRDTSLKSFSNMILNKTVEKSSRILVSALKHQIRNLIETRYF